MGTNSEKSEGDIDPVVEAYKKDIDRTLLRENLKLTPEERFRKLMDLQRFAEELRRAGREAKDQRSVGEPRRVTFKRSVGGLQPPDLLKKVKPMNKVVLDESQRFRVADFDSEAELCDSSGQTVGYYVPAEWHQELLYAWARQHVSDEELEKARRQSGGRTLQEILNRLQEA